MPDITAGCGCQYDAAGRVFVDRCVCSAVAAQRRRNAIANIIGAAELAGAHGLHLTHAEVDDMPEKVQRALRVLGVTDDEIAAVDWEDPDA